MGLTIHYKLKHAGDETSALRLITQLHSAAQDLPFQELNDIVNLEGDACDFNQRDQKDPLRWLLCQADVMIKLDGDRYLNVLPLRVIAFSTWPGQGCEEANFGLSLFPATIEHQGRRIKTNLDGWRCSSFCKTQYASAPDCGGVENFLRCHLLVVALLDLAKQSGLLGEVSDESHFWENRDLKKLTEEIGSWNQFIAAFAGQLKDVVGEGMEAPITSYPNFEQLEMAGQSLLPSGTGQLAKLIQQVIKKK
jgi:hypothetical protein